jgi:hypothetical protein
VLLVVNGDGRLRETHPLGHERWYLAVHEGNAQPLG